MKLFSPARALAALCIFTNNFPTSSALKLDPTQPSQVRDVAKKVVNKLVGMYATIEGKNIQVISGIPGLLTYPPYFWWEAGAMFGQLIDYWYYTGDDTYNDLVKEGILFQIGERQDLMPRNQSKDEGNDDQLFWAFTVMSAAELGFPDPSPDQPGWLALAQSVMNQLISRYQLELDDDVCGGGLRWQIYWHHPGYWYKNIAANGGMFQLGARLAKYTGNDTYAEWANRAFDWILQTPLISKEWQVFDGLDVKKDCKEADHHQWSYNYGIMLGGAAYMYNYTNGSDVWRERIDGFLNHTAYFFPKDRNDIMMEACEPKQLCNVDQFSFKAYLARWLAVTAQLAPFSYDRILPLLRHSGIAAAQSCAGGPDADLCGNRWYWEGFDGSQGVGQQMSALSMITSNLVSEVAGPYTADNGGTSKGNPNAGTEVPDHPYKKLRPITTGDRVGAGILTALVVGFFVGGGAWITFT